VTLCAAGWLCVVFAKAGVDVRIVAAVAVVVVRGVGDGVGHSRFDGGRNFLEFYVDPGI